MGHSFTHTFEHIFNNKLQLTEQNQLQQESISQISKKVSNLFFKLQCDQMDAKGNCCIFYAMI